MADDKYSIDDILAEVEQKKDDGEIPQEGFNGSVTDIIGGDELDEAIRTAKMLRSEKKSVGRQRSVQEEEMRRAREIAEAERRLAEARQREEEAQKKQEALEQKRRELEEAARLKKEERRRKKEEKLSAKQRTEEEVNERRSREISEAADKIAGEEGEEYVKPFVKPEVAEEDFIFHTRGDLVTTDTMQLRKQLRIEEINKALLSVDREAESPDELLDSLNPMESRARAAESLKADEAGDTLAVAGNDLKRLASEEHVKEYSPPSARRSRSDIERRADEILFSPQAAKQRAAKLKNPDIIDELKRKEKEREQNRSSETLDTLYTSQTPEDTANPGDTMSGSLSIEYEKHADDTDNSEEDEGAERVRRANELVNRKKRRLSGFILENIEEDVDAAAEDEEDSGDDTSEEIDLDDEAVINDRLGRAEKGLVGRLVILALLFAAALFIGISNQFDLKLGFLSDIVSRRTNPDIFLYSYLTIGILSFTACSSVITNGLSRLVRLRPDGDTLCAFAHITAIVALIPYLAMMEYVQRGRSQVYLIVSLAALCLNTISKLCIVKSARKNFAFTSGEGAKYFVERADEESAAKLAGSAVDGVPAVASIRKTELLCDFIISTYCEDASDRTSRALTPAVIALAVVGGIAAYIMGESKYPLNNLSWASTVASAVFSIGAAFSGSLIVTLPMLSASKKLNAKNAAVLGYGAVEEFSETNVVLTEARSLFPASSVSINNILNYNKSRKGSSPKIAIDEAIIYATSLAIASGSVLGDAFFDMLNYRRELLKPVNGCVYEANLGVLGWIDHRRVLLGNREHMKSHEITVPNMKKESAANKNNDEVIYLAIGGEVRMLFFVSLSADEEVTRNVRQLAESGITLVIKTVDGMMTEHVISELFDIDAERVHIIPFEVHETFTEHTRFVPKGCAAISCDGTFTSFAAAITAAKNLKEKIKLGCIAQIAGVALGIVLALIFTLFTLYGAFNVFFVLLYNLVCAAIALAIQLFKKTL